ncbi:MAG TPA: hypothetical protein PKO15_15300 [Fibrobacteria bacterium]|nr:hypothetical protein [Fibrobacteria bacterium]HOX50971.1 hypothetical protein [Fibrobacteria bacterium]
MKLRRAVPWLVAIALTSQAMAEKIYVFYPSMAKPNAVQSALQAKCPGSEITVFGRLADFTAMVGQTPPDVILAPKVLAEQFSGYKPFLKGTRGGSPLEDAVLVSTKPVDLAAVAGMNVGVVGVLERGTMNGYVQGMLGKLPKLKIVTKVEDLLPLLTFGSADAIVVGAGQADDIKGRSQANLQTTPASGKIGLVVASAKADASKTESALKGLGAAEKKMLGVDGWTK